MKLRKNKIKIHDNVVRIDINEVRKSPMQSIMDYDTIRQIAIYCMENPGNNDLYDKIRPGFEFAGLYPYTMKTLDPTNEDLLRKRKKDETKRRDRTS